MFQNYWSCFKFKSKLNKKLMFGGAKNFTLVKVKLSATKMVSSYHLADMQISFVTNNKKNQYPFFSQYSSLHSLENIVYGCQKSMSTKLQNCYLLCGKGVYLLIIHSEKSENYDNQNYVARMLKYGPSCSVYRRNLP